MKLIKWLSYAGIIVGLLRFAELYFLGDLHHGYAVPLAVVPLVSGALILWLVRGVEEVNGK